MHGDFNSQSIKVVMTKLVRYNIDLKLMRQSLKQVDDMRQHFVQNVSHEIKTPLTHIHRLLSTLQSNVNQGERDQIIHEIHEEVTHLSNLTKNYYYYLN